MTCIKAWVSLNFDLIPPLTMELAALNGVKIKVPTFFLGHFNSYLFNACR